MIPHKYLVYNIHGETNKQTTMSESWADTLQDLPAPQVTDNNDGTKTVVSYRYNDQKKKVKVTQKIKFVKITETVNPLVARRMKWKKFGADEGNTTVGPDSSTTQITEAVTFILSTTWKADEEREQELAKKNSVKSTLKCRVCGNTGHLSAKCPYKDKLGFDGLLKPAGAAGAGAGVGAGSGAADAKIGGGAFGSSRYVPPNLRAGGMSLKPVEEVPALRISNLNSAIDRDMLQDVIRSIPTRDSYDRVSVLRNRETGEPLGVAFVNMRSQQDAEAVKEALDGKGLMNMIISVDWARPKA